VALVWAIMATPTISAGSTDALRAVPGPLRDSALALGATRWEAITIGVLPHASRGIAASVLFGFARVLGEAAVVTLVLAHAPFSGAETLAALVAQNPSSGPGGAPVAAALAVLSVMLGVGARRLARSSEAA
jgi:phosphate transport system permease protein